METGSNDTNAVERTFSCARQRILCQNLYPPSLYGHVMANIVVGVLLTVTAVLGNGLVFAAYYYTPSLRKPANTILLSLAATDFLSGVILQPLYVYEKSHWFGSCTVTFCTAANFEKFFMLFFIGATLMNLSVTTLDRYIAVCRPYQYLELVTNSRVRKLLVSLWFVWMVASAVSAFFRNVTMLLTVVTSSNLIFISFLYVIIFREIHRLETNAVTTAQEATNARERKGAKTVAIILGLLVVCFAPFIFFGGIAAMKKEFITKEIVLLYASNAAFSNSSFNVFVYYWRNEDMRAAMLKVIRKITQRCNPQDDN